MNALRALMAQHDRIEGLLAELAQAAGHGGEARRAALAEVARELRKHLDLEESSFFPAVAPRLILVTAARFLEEHRGLREGLDRLESPEADLERDLPAFEVAVEQHFGDEEIELFPEVKRRFGVDELDELGERIEHATEGVVAPAAPESPDATEAAESPESPVHSEP